MFIIDIFNTEKVKPYFFFPSNDSVFSFSILYTSDAAYEYINIKIRGRRIIKKKNI